MATVPNSPGYFSIFGVQGPMASFPFFLATNALCCFNSLPNIGIHRRCSTVPKVWSNWGQVINQMSALALRKTSEIGNKNALDYWRMMLIRPKSQEKSREPTRGKGPLGAEQLGHHAHKLEGE
jgi:hypothetical protein